MSYSSATGQRIPNLAEQKLPSFTVEGTLRGMTFQAAPVSKPLGSFKRMCPSGHRVKVTGEVNWLQEENSNYMLGFWVILPGELPRSSSAAFGGPT